VRGVSKGYTLRAKADVAFWGGVASPLPSARGVWERRKLPVGSGAEPWPPKVSCILSVLDGFLCYTIE